MKIVLLHYAAHPIVGGVENVVRDHARLMAAHGHEVRVIAGRGEALEKNVAFTKLQLIDSQAPEVLAMKPELDAGRIPPAFEDMVRRIEKQLGRLLSGIDYLFAHNVCSLNKNLALTAALRRIAMSHRQMRVVLWHHDLAWTSDRYAGELHDGYPWDLLRTDWHEAIQVAVSSQRRAELARLLGVPGERIRVIPNGIDVGQFLGLGAQVEALRRELRLSEAAPLMLLPVRITPRKNIELALRVLAALRKEFPLARLLITGPVGPHDSTNAGYLDSLLALRRDLDLEDAAEFLTLPARRSLPDEAVGELYRLADLLFLPSVEEGFGIPILEAGLAGIPVFCSDIEPLRALGDSDVVFFAPNGEPASVAQQIGDSLSGSRRYAFRHRVLGEYQWERIFDTHLAPLLRSGRK